MTIDTINDPRPDAISHPTSGIDLESRIEQQRSTLVEAFRGLRGDKRPEASETRARLKARLSDLAHLLRWGVVDDWASLSGPLVNRLEQWLADSRASSQS